MHLFRLLMSVLLPISATILLYAPFLAHSQSQSLLVIQDHMNATLSAKNIILDKNPVLNSIRAVYKPISMNSSQQNPASSKSLDIWVPPANAVSTNSKSLAAKQGDFVTPTNTGNRYNSTSSISEASSVLLESRIVLDVITLSLFIDIVGFSWYFDGHSCSKTAHLALTYALAHSLLK